MEPGHVADFGAGEGVEKGPGGEGAGVERVGGGFIQACQKLGWDAFGEGLAAVVQCHAPFTRAGGVGGGGLAFVDGEGDVILGS